MVTREWLLNNGFSFRVYDGSESPEGEYTLRGRWWVIRIGWSEMFAWSCDVSNFDEHIYIKIDRQDNISIEQLRKMLEITKVEFKLK